YFLQRTICFENAFRKLVKLGLIYSIVFQPFLDSLIRFQIGSLM
ncbi:hypothetical protein X975_01239, partial [Stegodyphus mimosarum]